MIERLALLGVVCVLCACSNPSKTPVVEADSAVRSGAETVLDTTPPVEDVSTTERPPQEPESDAEPAVPEPVEHGGCRPVGFPPPGYKANAVIEKGRIDLRGDWRVAEGNRPGATRPNTKDAQWDTLAIPGAWKPDTIKGRRRLFWLRKRFQLTAKEAARADMALDLGGRIGKSEVWLNGKKLGAPDAKNGPFFRDGPLPLMEGENVIAIKLMVPPSTGTVRWYGDAALGRKSERYRGLVYKSFESVVDGTAQTMTVYIPTCADLSKPMPLVIALPGWGGNAHSFSQSRLLNEAETGSALFVTLDPRGNILYTGVSEQGVLEALEMLTKDFTVDMDRISLTGTSMGGAGAVQIGYHYPDRFASLVSFFGDSLYSLNSYAGPILRTKAKADRYSVLRFPANARNIPVLLVHAHDDHISPIHQSTDLLKVSEALGFNHHTLIDPRKGGHTLQLVDDHAKEAMDVMLKTRRIKNPPRVTFRTNANAYSKAYWLDVELRDEGKFGGTDISFDADERRITVHTLDKGLKAAWVDVNALNLSMDSALHLAVQETPEATLGFKGLSDCSAWTLANDEAPAESIALRAQEDACVLPITAKGTWTLDHTSKIPNP